ncbi:MAG: CAP domain-containing protein [Pseudomonadota bacterium]
MGKRMSLFGLLGALCLSSPALTTAQEGFSCLTEEQEALLQLVNDYRGDNGLPPVPWSITLTQVGQTHVEDARKNFATLFRAPCNLHSWSFDQPNRWSGMCYTSDHAQAQRMWDKPREISGGIFTGNGYELAASGYASIEAALRGWQNSPGHNPVMLNEGSWSSIRWRSMGVGVSEGSYYFLWFSDQADVRPPALRCEPELFEDDFEDGT